MAGNNNSSVSIIGAGFAGLAAASVLAHAGVQTDIYEKNDETGGRARKFTARGFTFDMGPSWYWMPDVFEKFYNRFGHTTEDFYHLQKLDPGFRVIFGPDEYIDVPADFEALCKVFENIEPGSAARLRKFMAAAEFKYRVGMTDLVYQPGLSVTEFFRYSLIRDSFKLQLFSSFREYVKKYFSDPRLISIIEFPVLFLGARPQDTPALYSLMNHAELKQGTFYPMGGFSKLVDAFTTIATSQGVQIHTSHVVENLEIADSKIAGIQANGVKRKTDAVIGAADYQHIESKLLDEKYRSYTNRHWEAKTFAPSCLIYYLGINKKIKALAHHNLFFDEDLDAHADEIYISKKWPNKPLFYVCCPSVTDSTVAPEGSENLFLLMPIAIGLADGEETREKYFKIMIERLNKYTRENIEEHIVFKQSYSVSNFVNDYNAYKGNAYGLANTLFQTAVFKPKMKSKKVGNLFFAGQLTTPGPGVPPSVISGQVAAAEVLKYLKKQNHERTV